MKCYWCGNEGSGPVNVRRCPHCQQEWGKDWGTVTCLLCGENSYEPKTLSRVLKEISDGASKRVTTTVTPHKQVCGNCLEDWLPSFGDICGWCGTNTSGRKEIVNHGGKDGTVVLGPEHLAICHECLHTMDGFANGHTEIHVGLALVKLNKACDICQEVGQWLYFTVVALDNREEDDTMNVERNYHGA